MRFLVAAIVIVAAILMIFAALYAYERHQVRLEAAIDVSNDRFAIMFYSNAINKFASLTVYGEDDNKGELLWDIRLNSLPERVEYGQCPPSSVQVKPPDLHRPRSPRSDEEIIISVGLQYDSWFDAYYEEWRFKFRYVKSEKQIMATRVNPKD